MPNSERTEFAACPVPEPEKTCVTIMLDYINVEANQKRAVTLTELQYIDVWEAVADLSSDSAQLS